MSVTCMDDGVLVIRTDAEEAATYSAPPVPQPAPPPTVTGNQWALALNDLGLADAFASALLKAKASDRIRWGMVARDTLVVTTYPPLVRIAAQSGGAVDIPTVFAKAQTE